MAPSLATLLKRHRSSARMTQEELAEKAEVSARTVSDVERGLRRRIYRGTATRFAEALGLRGNERREFEAAARGEGPSAPPRERRLPIPPTRLIGRERQVEAVVEALSRPEVRMVTVTGPGGIGKTRVALEAASRETFADASFVDLSEITDPSQVIREIARAVGVPGTRIPTVDVVAEQLEGRATLLLLDTLEHVVDAAADIARLLASAPGVRILATSREALRIRGEHRVPIPPLPLPSTVSLDAVLDAPATALFLERAREHVPTLEVDTSSVELIAEICRRLEGLPLAIELAAARVRHVPLSTLRDQLEHALDVLVEGARDLPPRQRTMRDAIAWSYGLLGPSEKATLLDLSVFTGGWTLEAASAVRGVDAFPPTSGLVDNNLVVRIDDDPPRWDMLDVIRGFAAELRRGEEAERRHTAYFLALAEAAEPGLGTSEQPAWLRRLAGDHDNIRAVLRRTLDAGDAATGLRIGGAIWRFWLIHGDLTEGRGWLAEALDLRGGAADALVRAKALWGLAWLAYHQGDHEVVEGCAREMLRLAEPLDDPVQMRNALTIRGISDLAHGRLTASIPAFERGVELLRGTGPTWLLATSLLNLGTALGHAGDDRARSILERARDMYVELGDERFAARSVMYLGYAAFVSGDVRRARDRIRDALIAFWELDDLWGVTESLEGIAATSGSADDGARAIRLAAAAEALRERVNMRPFPADHALLEGTLGRVRSMVDDPAWSRNREAGRALGLDEAVEEALRST